MSDAKSIFVALFIVGQICHTKTTTTRNGIKTEDIRFFMNDGDDIPDTDSDLTFLRVRTLKREKRTTRVTNHPGYLEVILEDDSGKVNLELEPNDEVIAPNFKLVIDGSNGTEEEIPLGLTFPNCLYKGRVKQKGAQSFVALSTCDGAGYSGVLFDGEKTHLIRPQKSPKEERSKREADGGDEITPDGLHVIHSRTTDSKCAVRNLQAMMAPIVYVELNETSVMENEWNKRKRDYENEKIHHNAAYYKSGQGEHVLFKRNARKKYRIETAVFTDEAMYNFISRKVKKDKIIEELKNAVFTIMNGVNIIYNGPSMRTSISVVMVRLEVMKNSKLELDDAKGDIQLYLSNFCNWQKRKKKKLQKSGVRDTWDHGLLLSGVDLWDVKPSLNKVIGLAWVGGMCNSFYSCTINEGTSFEAQFVIAHEIGHNLNLSHDGSHMDGNDCAKDKFLMSSSTGPGKISWSVCSNRELETFLGTSYNVACLEDSSEETNKIATRSGTDKTETLPGEDYDIHEQCAYALGQDFKPYITSTNPYDAVCRELWCQNRSHAMRTHPALEGSVCDIKKHCINGACVTTLNSGAFGNPVSPDSSNEIPDDKPVGQPRGRSGSGFNFSDLFKRIRNLFNKYLAVSRSQRVVLLSPWKLSNLTECSASCGGGWQTGRLECNHQRSQRNRETCILPQEIVKTTCNTLPCS